MTQLTVQEKEELKVILGNQYASGPFSGMVYNAVVSSGKSIDECLKLALQTKIRLKELAQ
jgi:hypothetical protein